MKKAAAQLQPDDVFWWEGNQATVIGVAKVTEDGVLRSVDVLLASIFSYAAGLKVYDETFSPDLVLDLVSPEDQADERAMHRAYLNRGVTPE